MQVPCRPPRYACREAIAELGPRHPHGVALFRARPAMPARAKPIPRPVASAAPASRAWGTMRAMPAPSSTTAKERTPPGLLIGLRCPSSSLSAERSWPGETILLIPATSSREAALAFRMTRANVVLAVSVASDDTLDPTPIRTRYTIRDLHPAPSRGSHRAPSVDPAQADRDLILRGLPGQPCPRRAPRRQPRRIRVAASGTTDLGGVELGRRCDEQCSVSPTDRLL